MWHYLNEFNRDVSIDICTLTRMHAWQEVACLLYLSECEVYKLRGHFRSSL